MKINKFLIVFALLFGLCGMAAAQNPENSAEDDFNNYDRGLIQSSPAKTKNPKTRPKVSPPVKSKRPRNQSAVKSKPNTLKTAPSIGLPGIKVWFERQFGCQQNFSPVSSTSVFTTGDCVRVRFETNFEGYLTIVNLGTSGEKSVIFPSKGSSNLIAARSNNYLPDKKGWELTGDTGNEHLFFVVSNAPPSKNYLDEIGENESSTTRVSSDIEVYDRDLTARTENESVYVLADEKKLEKALVFRLTLKHR